MSRKKAETTVEERKIIFKLHQEGESYVEIAKLIGRSKYTIQYIIKRVKTNNILLHKKRVGRPKILIAREGKTLIRQVQKNPRISAPKLVTMCNNMFNKTVSAETCRRILRSENFHGRAARKKPFINKINRAKRLAFAKEYVNKSNSFWQKVIFSDESRFNIFGCDGTGKVWRKPNKELELKNLRPTVKHGGGSVMVWGCMAASGVGNLVFIDGLMDKYKYKSILEQNLQESAVKLGMQGNYYFQHDNDPKHTAQIVREWILYHIPDFLSTPPQSPDVNRIENLWAEIEKRLRKHEISNKQILKEKILEVWNRIEQSTTEKLIKSMQNRLIEIIKHNGGPTKY
ncbi:Transposable element Tc1 transposase [Anthophora quadrimaculata]